MGKTGEVQLWHRQPCSYYYCFQVHFSPRFPSAPITPAKAFSSARPFSQTTTCVNMRAWATSHVNIPPPVQDCISSVCWVVTEPVPSLSLSMCLGEAIPVVSTLFHTVRKVTGMWQPYQFHHSSWQLHPCCF